MGRDIVTTFWDSEGIYPGKGGFSNRVDIIRAINTLASGLEVLISFHWVEVGQSNNIATACSISVLKLQVRLLELKDLCFHRSCVPHPRLRPFDVTHLRTLVSEHRM